MPTHIQSLKLFLFVILLSSDMSRKVHEMSSDSDDDTVVYDAESSVCDQTLMTLDFDPDRE